MDYFSDILNNKSVDIIKWEDKSSDTIIHKFPDEEIVIKKDSYLNVMPFQKAIFVYNGKVIFIFEAGCYRLDKNTLSMIMKRNKIDGNYKKILKGKIYFVKKDSFEGIKWKSDSSIMIRDGEYGPVSITIDGDYRFKVKDIEKFLNNFFIKSSKFKRSEMIGYLKYIITNIIFDFFSEIKIAVIDLGNELEYLSEKGLEVLKPKFDELGFSLTNFSISKIFLPEWMEYTNLDKNLDFKF